MASVRPENTADYAKKFDIKQHWNSASVGEANRKRDAAASDLDEDTADFSEERDDSRFESPGNSKQPHIPVLCREVMDCFWRLDNLAG